MGEMKLNDMNPFLQRIHWAVPFIGVLVLLLFPVYFLVLAVVEAYKDGAVRHIWDEAFLALTYKPWSIDQ